MTSSRTTAATPPDPAANGTAEDPAGPAGRNRVLGRLAAAGVIGAVLIMIAAGLLRTSWMPPSLSMPAIGPPWELAVRGPARLIIIALWVAGLLAAGGVAAGLGAVRRGEQLPIRTLLVAGAIGVAALAVLPPIGSTDVLDYAIYGHIAALGRSPYVMTPYQYRVLFRVRQGVPVDWVHDPSYYGPLATAEQWAAAKLGGASLAAATFWLKLVNALAFAGVAWCADIMLCSDRAARLRAHVLWTANPLLIWSLIGGGHLDVLAAAVGLAGLLCCDRREAARPMLRALVAGLCVGAATDIKLDYALFALAAAVALGRRPRQLLVAAGGFALVLVPSYAAVGIAAIKALALRASVGEGYGFYGIFLHHLGLRLGYAVPIAVCLTIPAAWLVLHRLPARMDGHRAVRAALALSLAWLLLWPHQFAWYSVMIFCVLVFFPASRLDWVAVAWLSAITIADMPGIGIGRAASRMGPVLSGIQQQNIEHMAPLVMLGAVVALVLMSMSGRWHAPRRPDLAPVART